MGLGRAHERTDGWRGVLVFAAAGILGGIGGALVVALAVDRGGRSIVDLSPAPSIMALAVVAGGVVAGWFVATLLLSRTGGRTRCPRCGTVNDRDAVTCRACRL